MNFRPLQCLVNFLALIWIVSRGQYRAQFGNYRMTVDHVFFGLIRKGIKGTSKNSRSFVLVRVCCLTA